MATGDKRRQNPDRNYLPEQIALTLSEFLRGKIGEGWETDNTHLEEGVESYKLTEVDPPHRSDCERRRATFWIGVTGRDRGYRITVHEDGDTGDVEIKIMESREKRNGARAHA